MQKFSRSQFQDEIFTNFSMLLANYAEFSGLQHGCDAHSALMCSVEITSNFLEALSPQTGGRVREIVVFQKYYFHPHRHCHASLTIPMYGVHNRLHLCLNSQIVLMNKMPSENDVQKALNHSHVSRVKAEEEIIFLSNHQSMGNHNSIKISV